MTDILPSRSPVGVKSPLPAVFEPAFGLCALKARAIIKALADNPKTFSNAVDGDYAQFPEGFFEIGNWTSSFFTGMALLAYRKTRDQALLDQVLRLDSWYYRKVHDPLHATNTMHDLGFLYSLYAVAIHQLTGSADHKAMAVRAAEVLAGRFIENGRYIRAWGRMDEKGSDYEGLAIIDCLMNLPLLFWASEHTGNPRFKNIATAHADTTLHFFVRPDFSVFHAYRFDPATGKPVSGDNYCGQSIPSHWARGTAWAIYGFAMAYRYTGDKRYFDASESIAKKFISLLDEELVPLWDFRLPKEMPQLRDSSAAAVAACGMQELIRVGSTDPQFATIAVKLLERLCTEDYLNSDLTCLGVLRDGQIGDGVGYAKNAYTSWGDYYLMEGLATALGHGKTFW